ncbi:MAG: hypothetical protein V1839_00420 [archaeon]
MRGGCRMIGKKAFEWPTFMMQGVFTMLLFIVGLMIVQDITGMHANAATMKTGSFDFGSNAARIINSKDCLSRGGEAGIIDLGKIAVSQKAAYMGKCLIGRDYYINVTIDTASAHGLSASVFSTPTLSYVISSKITESGGAFYDSSGKKLNPIYYDWFAVQAFYPADNQIYDGVALIAVR